MLQTSGLDVVRKQEHLHHGSTRESPDHRSGARLDLRRRLTHLHAGDPFDLLPKRARGAGKKLPVKFLHLGGAVRVFGQGLLAL